MMNSLFSSFDPSSFNIKMITMTPILMSMLVISMGEKIMVMINLTKNYLMKELKMTIKNSMITFLMISLFITNSLFNMFSMTPFSFTMNSQVSVVFPLSVTLFLSILMVSIKFKPKSLLAHLVPMGSPLLMSPLLVLIELVSLMIRPITLSVRMVANMMTGHLMMHLLSSTSSSINMYLPIIMPLSSLLFIVEMAVAILQSYIMMTLVSIYFSE